MWGQSLTPQFTVKSSGIVEKMNKKYLNFVEKWKLSSKVNLESGGKFLNKNLLKKFDWWPSSNIDTSPKLSERVRCTRLKKFVVCLLREAANWFLGLTTVWHVRLLNFSVVPILLQGCQSNFSRFFFQKNWCQIQDLLFRKAAMFHPSWGKLRPFFHYYTM